MAGSRKGLYDDRPKEKLMAPIKLEGPYPKWNQLGDDWGSISTDRYEAQVKIRAKIRAEINKERWSKVLTFFCKAIILSVVIFYGMLILEVVLVSKPFSRMISFMIGTE